MARPKSKPDGEPPADLHARKLLIKNFDGPLYRISELSRGRSGAVYFGKARTERFDDPQGKYGVCYLGTDIHAAFIETFGQAQEILLDLSFVQAMALCTLRAKRVLQLADITGPGKAWIGAAGEISAGDHTLSQRWSRQLFLHPDQIDGIYYRCRHDQNRMSIALFDRDPKILAVEQYSAWSELPEQLGALLGYYHMGIRS